ncbi:MAG: insulinase family protein, partial [Selenomonas sp.]|nr:insulinase family protein [Selenomonas sp.]
MKVNDRIHGFKVINRSESKETSSVAWTFEHEKSGARLFFLENDDDNKVFSISFRTPPVDDTGVAHIVEHSTLCGSRKYPLKEPFVELVKGSLNTFLNAMTYPDKTMYPVASRNDKDFQNLMDVYLDAVFYPYMLENPQVLMQEGWHYEIEKPEDPLVYSGVVYNEMKGALSAPDDLLESRIMAALYPDTTYGYESGGDPEAIPNLSYEMFKNFHQRYYHPSNSYIYLYGDLDIEEKLAYLDREYLSAFTRIEVPSKIEKQQPFSGLLRQNLQYPAGPDEDTAEKSFLSLSWVMGDSLNLKDAMGLDILEHALLRTQAAPLRKALIDAQLGKDVDSSYEEDILQPFFSIIINNSETDRADKFYSLVYATLKKLADEGIDKTLLEASINLMEFRLREADFGSAPKGLIYGIRIMRTWLYDGIPEAVLAYEEIIRAMKEGLHNGYFEDLIRRYFLNNPHAALLTMAPSKTMA